VGIEFISKSETKPHCTLSRCIALDLFLSKHSYCGQFLRKFYSILYLKDAEVYALRMLSTTFIY